MLPDWVIFVSAVGGIVGAVWLVREVLHTMAVERDSVRARRRIGARYGEGRQ